MWKNDLNVFSHQWRYTLTSVWQFFFFACLLTWELRLLLLSGVLFGGRTTRQQHTELECENFLMKTSCASLLSLCDEFRAVQNECMAVEKELQMIKSYASTRQCFHKKSSLIFSLTAQRTDFSNFNSQNLHKDKCKVSYVNMKHAMLYSPLRLQQRSHLFSLSSTNKFCNSKWLINREHMKRGEKQRKQLSDFHVPYGWSEFFRCKEKLTIIKTFSYNI